MAMTDGVTTRLQKEVTQFQKELERMDARTDEKLEKMGDKLRTDLFAELRHAVEHFNTEVSSIKQLLHQSDTVKRGKQTPKIMELGFFDRL